MYFFHRQGRCQRGGGLIGGGVGRWLRFAEGQGRATVLCDQLRAAFGRRGAFCGSADARCGALTGLCRVVSRRCRPTGDLCGANRGLRGGAGALATATPGANSEVGPAIPSAMPFLELECRQVIVLNRARVGVNGSEFGGGRA